MSKNQSFNCAIRLGGKDYPAGQPVPVGGRNGLPDDEVKRLAENFGLWKGAPAPAAGADASAEVVRLQAANAELSGQIHKVRSELDQALKDNEVLAARVEELEKAGQ